MRISKNHAFLTCITRSWTFRPILRSIGLLDNELPRKEIISTDDGSKKEKATKKTRFESYLVRKRLNNIRL